MSRKKRRGFWNVLIIFTLLVCGLAFAAHMKNWKQVRPDEIRLLSGFYYLRVPFEEVKEVAWAEKVSYLSRRHGFSAGQWEKGSYRDSAQPGLRAWVMVDDWEQPKLRIAWGDSLLLYLNFRDSLETESLHQLLLERTAEPVE